MPSVGKVDGQCNSSSVAKPGLVLPHLPIAALYIGVLIPDDWNRGVLAVLHHGVELGQSGVVVCLSKRVWRVVDGVKFSAGTGPIHYGHCRDGVEAQRFSKADDFLAEIKRRRGLQN